MNQPNEHFPELLRDSNLYIIFSLTVMTIIGVFSIAPALPRIFKELDW